MHGNVYADENNKRRINIPDVGITIIPSVHEVRVYRAVHEEEHAKGNHVGSTDVPPVVIEAAQRSLNEQKQLLQLFQGDPCLMPMFRYEVDRVSARAPTSRR
jgi:hypothetical protein